ncbi:MAG: serine/threonine protein kinase [Blastopirellula sp.]|nr:MAG: serine/threonine protein kinase [Blastopirellula sp.]
MSVRIISVLILFATLTNGLLAAEWSQFRGPHTNGISDELSAPTQWSAEKNIKWKVELPSPGNGSAIVSSGKVFLTYASKTGEQRTLACYDRNNGKQLWEKTVEFDKELPTHKTNPYAGTTPAANGKQVVVWHASAGLHCYDMNGKPLWSRDLGEFKHMWGYGTSPVIYQDRVILHSGPGELVFVAAFNLKTGQTIWRTTEPLDGIERNLDDKYMGSWATPVLAKLNGKMQAIVMMPTRVVAYDVNSGLMLWNCEGLSGPKGDLSYSSVQLSDDLLVAFGGFSGPSMAVRVAGSGNITDKAQLWRSEAKNPQSIGSGVMVGKYVYRANAGPGTIECMNGETGEVVWVSRESGKNAWGSIVKVGHHLYVVNQDGTTVVFKDNPEKFELVAKNDLDDSCNTTPAISDGNIFLRCDKHLWCIGK